MSEIESLLSSLSSNEINLDYWSFAESLLVATVLGVGIKFLYTMYFRANEPQDAGFARSLALLTPVISSMFWVIQGSVALSLGLIGSMAFVRFRTPVKRSEDAVFLVLALTVAIACAIKAYPIGVGIMAILGVFVIIRNFERQTNQNAGRNAVVTLNVHKNLTGSQLAEPFQTEKVPFELVSSRSFDGTTSYVFNVTKLMEERYSRICAYYMNLDSAAQVNVFYPSHRLGT